MYQNRDLVCAGGAQYLITYSTPVNVVSFAALTGDYSVRMRKNVSGGAQGLVSASGPSPMTPPITNDWFHVPTSATPTAGADRGALDGFYDPVIEIDVYCNSPGELIVLAH